MRIVLFAIYFLCSTIGICQAIIPEKVLICGVCKNVEKAIPNTIYSIMEVGAHFADYQVVIYENNSKDRTKELFQAWAQQDRRVIFISETLPKKKIAKEFAMKVYNRTEAIARARNKVLDVIMQPKYDDFKYVIWADLDFLNRWDVANIIDTITRPEQEWDAVFANGAYDLFAYRDPEFPIGFELMGNLYWEQLPKMRAQLAMDPKGPWKKVYSAFGGLGIYKREAIKGCRYSGVVTPELEEVTVHWLANAKCNTGVCFAEEYQKLLSTKRIIELKQERFTHRGHFPKEMGMRLFNSHGKGKVVWFSCTDKANLPWTCEHVPFHASMILKGHDKLFINPRLISIHP
jgi:glycosyltransferase involved in cell wall biosynthesis